VRGGGRGGGGELGAEGGDFHLHGVDGGDFAVELGLEGGQGGGATAGWGLRRRGGGMAFGGAGLQLGELAVERCVFVLQMNYFGVLA